MKRPRRGSDGEAMKYGLIIDFFAGSGGVSI